MQDRGNDERSWGPQRPNREGPGEYGYRGDAPSDNPRSSVPGSQGTHGISSGRSETGRGNWSRHGSDEWRRGYGGYGVSGRGPSPESGWAETATPGTDLHGYDRGETPFRDHAISDERPGRWRGMDAWSVPGPYTGRGPQDYRRSESAIREEVCERLTRHGQVDASGISVRVENGEVVLEGDVDSRAAKRMAEDAADTVSGVRDVHNRLRVRHRD